MFIGGTEKYENMWKTFQALGFDSGLLGEKYFDDAKKNIRKKKCRNLKSF